MVNLVDRFSSAVSFEKDVLNTGMIEKRLAVTPKRDKRGHEAREGLRIVLRLQ
jgi:hypothetical protein